jgi:hypothetical protein
VVAGDCEYGRPECAQHLGGPLELRAATAVGEVARCDDQLRLGALHEPRECTFDLRLLMCTHMQVGNMEEHCPHDRTRL